MSVDSNIKLNLKVGQFIASKKMDHCGQSSIPLTRFISHISQQSFRPDRKPTTTEDKSKLVHCSPSSPCSSLSCCHSSYSFEQKFFDEQKPVLLTHDITTEQVMPHGFVNQLTGNDTKQSNSLYDITTEQVMPHGFVNQLTGNDTKQSNSLHDKSLAYMNKVELQQLATKHNIVWSENMSSPDLTVLLSGFYPSGKVNVEGVDLITSSNTVNLDIHYVNHHITDVSQHRLE